MVFFDFSYSLLNTIWKKSDNNEYTIKVKSRKSGKLSDKDIVNLINQKDYQKITVITEKGQKIALIQEERIKVWNIETDSDFKL